MNTDIGYDLTLDHWAALKALRLPAADRGALYRPVLENLIALQLAAMSDEGLAITARGRSVLLRGSPRLWDVAA
jgi:hypothetical protein